MSWENVRATYPDSWVLIEALDATTREGRREVSALQLVGEFGSQWDEAWLRYKTLHHADTQREYYVLHTSRESLEIGVIDTFGRVLS